ncbi:MAG TPA: tetratricopeptide repeat protein, partial [Anaerolineales bacterium]|nr:tetratricopeptide repeat protein [Anaerolineales bacterium]
LLVENGDKDQAEILYKRALVSDPGNENITWNCTRFLMWQVNDREKARDMLNDGLRAHRESGRLHLLQGELNLLDGKATEAVESFRRARETGADQADVEYYYAFALHMSGGPIRECIAAYHVAIALKPKDGALRLNLAQLLFVKGDDTEASRQLQEAIRLGFR